MKSNLANGLYAAFDIGSFSIKVSLIERRDGRNRLTSVSSEPLKPFADFPGENEFRDHQIQVIKQLGQKLPLKDCRETFCGFNHRELQVKIVDLPREIQLEQVDNVLLWEAKKLLSPALKNEPFLFGYRKIRDLPPAYALTVIPQIRLQKLHDLFQSAGIKLTGAYPEVFNALTIKENLPTSGMPALSLINLGHVNTHIQIFSAGELKFYRHIPSGVSEIAERQTPKDLEVLAQKIRFSFDYFRAVSKLAHIDETIFMGGGACHKEFIKFCRDYFAPGKVDLLDLSSIFDVSPVLAGLGGETSKLQPYLPCLGVFLAHSDPEAGSFNLAYRLQSIYDQERAKQLASFLPLALGSAGLALIIILFFFVYQSAIKQREDARQEASIAELSVAGNRTKVAKLQAKTVRTTLTDLERRTLHHLLRDRLSGGEILYKIAVNKPEDLVLQSIGIQGTDESSSETEEADSLPPEEPKEETAVASDDASLNPEPIPTPMAEPVKKGAADGKETLGEEILVIKGSCENYTSIMDYIEKLRTAHVIQRYRLFQTARKAGEKARFTILGELP